MMESMPICPHCGSSDSVYRNVRVSGYAGEFFDEIGYGGDIPNTDQLNYGHPKTLRCTACQKIRKDVITVDYNYLMLRGYTEKK